MHNLFGQSQTEAFQEIAQDLNAEYREVDSRSKSARGRIDVPFGPWTIVIDISESDNVDGRSFYTRLRAAFVSATPDDFKFEIYRGDFLTRIGKIFGLQDIEIGDDRFDKDFIIQGNNEEQVQSFLQNKEMRTVISQLEHFHFNIDEKGEKANQGLPKGVGILTFRIGGIVTEDDKIKQFLELMKMGLTQMVNVQLAKEESSEFLI